MNTLAERIRECRKARSFSQQKLAVLAEVHYTTIGKNECGESIPTVYVLKRNSQALELSSDYLFNGTMNDKANKSNNEQELFQKFKKVEQLPENKTALVKEFPDAFLFKSSIQSQLTIQ